MSVSVCSSSVAIVIQARTYSQRLPYKVFRTVCGRPMIFYLCERLQQTGISICLAVPIGEGERFLFLKSLFDLLIVEGPSEDVLLRYYQAATWMQVDTVIRVTADNPFTSSTCMITLFELHQKHQADLSYYTDLPYGAGVEIIQTKCLQKANKSATDQAEREHPTQYMYNHPDQFHIRSFQPPKAYRHPSLRVTVDTPQDFHHFRKRLLTLQATPQNPSTIVSLRSIIQQERRQNKKARTIPCTAQIDPTP